MVYSTRDRLLDAGARLFAEHGYRGASVRDICNLAGANPGAVSYHFGGKRQLFRSVLRRATADLAPFDEFEVDAPLPDPVTIVHAIQSRLASSPVAARLLLHDLADGGDMAVETLVPHLRAAFERLSSEFGESDAEAERTSRLLFLRMAAPIALMATVAPVLTRALDVDEPSLRNLVIEAVTVR